MGVRFASEGFKVDAATVTRRRSSAAPRRLKTDLFILGAGIAGVSAAIEAARLGLRTVLADSAPSLGGQSTGTLIGTICGLYANGPDPRQLTFGIATEFLRDLATEGAVQASLSRRNTRVIRYRHGSLLRWIERALVESGVRPLSGATLVEVRREQRRLRSVLLATPQGTVEVSAEAFLDASGDAALAWQADLAVREPASHTVFGSQNAVLLGVDEAAARQLDAHSVVERLKQTATRYGLDRKDAYFFTLPGGSGETVLNMTHVATPLDPLDASLAAIAGHDKVDRGLDFLRTEFPAAFGCARIGSYGTLGVRQTRWIAGLHQLSAGEVRAATRFDDAVARTAWPIELHHDVADIYWEEFDEAHVHTIPLRSLIHAEADNLMAAGRCIDADVLALSSVRVMGPCIAMGAAAAHAFHLAGPGRAVRDVDIAALRQRLIGNLEDRA